MPSKANNFSFELTCLICSETFRNQADIKNHGCRKLSIKCGCCLNTFTVRNELAEHLNQQESPAVADKPARRGVM